MESKNCRNGGNIFEIVKRFHPNSPLISQFLMKDGVANITVFDDANLKIKLGEALQDAYKYVENHQISIVTNESSISGSIISNFEFVKSNNLDWRSFVLNDLKSVRNSLLKDIRNHRSGSSLSEIPDLYHFLSDDELEEYFA